MQISCNDQSPREALGLIQSQHSNVYSDLGPYVDQLRGLKVTELSAMLESLVYTLEERLAAGLLVGILGLDPRIQTFSPQMFTVDAAEFQMGTEASKVPGICSEYSALNLQAAWIEKELPQHKRFLKRYSIGKYLVTNFEYKKFLEENVSGELPTSWSLGIYPAEKSNHPVYSISHSAAQTYCSWLSSRTQRKFRLPTEAEWEYAASGGDSRVFPWGDAYFRRVCNTLELSLYTTTPVGVFPSGASALGLLDMGGNVEEHVANYYSPYPSGALIEDDVYKLYGGPYPMTRGGSFARNRDLARCQRRHGFFPKEIYPTGFRLAEDF